MDTTTNTLSEEKVTTENQTASAQPINKADKLVEDLRINPEWVIISLLSFFLGFLGVHRFYVGKIGTGLLMIFTFGGFGIWSLIDFIMVICGKFETKEGQIVTMRLPATTS